MDFTQKRKKKKKRKEKKKQTLEGKGPFESPM